MYYYWFVVQPSSTAVVELIEMAHLFPFLCLVISSWYLEMGHNGNISLWKLADATTSPPHPLGPVVKHRAVDYRSPPLIRVEAS